MSIRIMPGRIGEKYMSFISLSTKKRRMALFLQISTSTKKYLVSSLNDPYASQSKVTPNVGY